MEGTKIFIIGGKPIDKVKIANTIQSLNDDLNIADIYTNDDNYKNSANDKHISYMKQEDILLSFKNNAFLTIKTDVYLSECITKDSFYNCDIFMFDFDLFNNISIQSIKDKDILVVWVDSKQYNNKADKDHDLAECKYTQELVNNFPCLYYIDEDPERIAQDVIRYLDADIDGRYAIVDENN